MQRGLADNVMQRNGTKAKKSKEKGTREIQEDAIDYDLITIRTCVIQTEQNMLLFCSQFDGGMFQRFGTLMGIATNVNYCTM